MSVLGSEGSVARQPALPASMETRPAPRGILLTPRRRILLSKACKIAAFGHHHEKEKNYVGRISP
eukprot:881262-Pelagomonas_calceolata.AAC.1